MIQETLSVEMKFKLTPDFEGSKKEEKFPLPFLQAKETESTRERQEKASLI